MDSNNPKITQGWINMRDLYDIKSDSHMQFQYLGNSLFHVIVFKGGCTPRSLSTFMCRISHQETRSIFSVKLTKYQSKASHLVYALRILFIISSII